MIRKTAVLVIPAFIFFLATMTAASERLAVQADIANIRSGPERNAVVLWQVEKYYPLNIIEKKGDWMRFQDFEGDQGWIHTSVVGRLSTVIVKASKCNLRTGPGTQYDVAFTAAKGIPFKVLQTKEKWIEVEHADGDKGWIFKDLVW